CLAHSALASYLRSFPTRRSSDLPPCGGRNADKGRSDGLECVGGESRGFHGAVDRTAAEREPIRRLSSREVHRIHRWGRAFDGDRSEEHTSELQSRFDLVCRLLLE